MISLPDEEVAISDRVSSARQSPTKTRHGDPDLASSNYSNSSRGVDSRDSRELRARNEGGFDGHAASYGNCDGRYRSYGASEVGSYAAEGYMVSRSARRGGSGVRGYSNMADLEGQGEWNLMRLQLIFEVSYFQICPLTLLFAIFQLRLKGSDGPSRRRLYRQDHLDGEPPSHLWTGSESDSAYTSTTYSHTSYSQNTAESSYLSRETASTDTSAGDYGGTHRRDHEDAKRKMRKVVTDFSSLVATYVASGLSLVLGIFLTLVSPIVRVVKLIVGDVRGLLNMSIFADLGHVWRHYRNLRRKAGRMSSPRNRRDDESGMSYYSEDYSHSSAGTSNAPTMYSDESSTQFVGGWSPSLRSGSRAGSMESGRSHGSGASSRVSGGRHNKGGVSGHNSASSAAANDDVMSAGSASTHGSAATSAMSNCTSAVHADMSRGTHSSGGPPRMPSHPASEAAASAFTTSRSYSSLPLVHENWANSSVMAVMPTTRHGDGKSVRSAGNSSVEGASSCPSRPSSYQGYYEGYHLPPQAPRTAAGGGSRQRAQTYQGFPASRQILSSRTSGGHRRC